MFPSHLKHPHHPMGMMGLPLPTPSSLLHHHAHPQSTMVQQQSTTTTTSSHGSAAKSNAKLPPFLKKLVDLTNSCPPHIGGWNEDGTQFVVRSSQFADLLREQFQGSLQTFVRQLHFYSFNKKDDGARGIWTFSHPHFLRGKPHLLVNIERKSNPKKKGGKDDSDDEGPAPQRETTPAAASSSSSAMMGVDKAAFAALEKRLAQMEKKLERMAALETEVSDLKHELVALKDFAAAQNLLSLAPSSETKKRVKEDPLKSVDDNMARTDKDDSLMNLQPPSKITRLISTDSVLGGELRDFPFEDTSSVGSTSVRDILRELQTDIFSTEFDDFLPASSKLVSVQGSPAPTNVVHSSSDAATTEAMGCKEGGECFSIPNGFELQPGVTIPLLKQVYCVTRRICCPNSQGWVSTTTTDKLKKLVDDLTPPQTLPPVELCGVTRDLLPFLREHVTEEASDLALMKAARQVYEVYYQTVQKKISELGHRPTYSAAAAACSKDASSSQSQ